MAKKTLIRNERPHEVKLGERDKVAQSHKVDAAPVPVASTPKAARTLSVPASEVLADLPQDPPSPPKAILRRKTRAGAGQAAPDEAPAPSKRQTAAKTRGKAAAIPTAAPASKAKKAAKTTPKTRKPAPSRAPAASPEPAEPAGPLLPAWVPADRLWEDDSAVAQRLQALLQRNARLNEQLQRLQQGAPLKGFQP